MDFEKIDEELAADDNQSNRQRYNTQYLVADLKESNRAPKIIIISAIVLILAGVAFALLSGGNENQPTTENTVAPVTTTATANTDAASDKSK